MQYLVTGATGFLGGHVAQTLASQGHQVFALVRNPQAASHLADWNVTVREGNLEDPASIESACQDIDGMVHCAAKVDEWGKIDGFRAVNVEGFRHLLEAAKKADVKHVVLIGSLGVYPAKNHEGTDETAPLPPKHIDSYTQTKVEQEQLALEFFQKHQLPITILRPGFIYGPRDRIVMPRILKNLQKKLVTYFGSKHKKMNQVYVGNVVEAVIAAFAHPESAGQVYNITDAEPVSKKHFFNSIADLAGLPAPNKVVPYWVGQIACSAMGLTSAFSKKPPLLTPARLKFMGLNLHYSIEKAKKELSYNPSTQFDDGIKTTIEWFKQEDLIPTSDKEPAKSSS